MPTIKPAVLRTEGLLGNAPSGSTLIDGDGNALLTVADLIDNLTTSDSLKPLAANQGVQLKKLLELLAFEIVADEEVMVVDAIAEDDSTDKKYIVTADSNYGGNTTMYRCTADVDAGDWAANSASFTHLSSLDVQILETELSSLLNSTATDIALNLAGAKILQDQIDALEQGISGAIPWQEYIEVTAQVLTDGYFVLDFTPINAVHIQMHDDMGGPQTNKKAITAKSGSPSPDFEADANVPRRIYIRDRLADHDGAGTELHENLSEDFIEGDTLCMTYSYATN